MHNSKITEIFSAGPKPAKISNSVFRKIAHRATFIHEFGCSRAIVTLSLNFFAEAFRKLIW
jgi:hypothetical protein